MEPSPVTQERAAALVSLLADETAKVRDAAQAALVAGEWTPDELRSLAESIDDPSLRARVRAGLETVRLARLESELRTLVNDKPDLETGAFLLARFEYPDLDVRGYRGQLDSMAAALAPELA